MSDRFERIERRDPTAQMIDIEGAERLKGVALSLIGQPGVHRYVSRSTGVEHHVAYATALLPDGTSMGPDVSELFLQSLVDSSPEDDTDQRWWRALMSVLRYTEQFDNYNARHIYEVKAQQDQVVEARYRVFSVYDAKRKLFSQVADELMSGGELADLTTRRSLRDVSIRPEHIDQLGDQITRGLARVASTSFRISPGTRPAKFKSDVGDMTDGADDNNPYINYVGPENTPVDSQVDKGV